MIDAPILFSRYFNVPACSDTFTKSTAVKVSQLKSAQLCYKRLSARIGALNVAQQKANNRKYNA